MSATSSPPAPGPGGTKPSTLVERLAQDMRRRWAAGERPLVEEYLARHPHLGARPDAAAELLYEEISLREAHGQKVSTEEVLRRFPQWEAPLRVLLDCHRLLGADGAAPRFPEKGEALGGFLLRAELGRGARGRVFLAAQSALADRPVVLKLVPRGGDEHLSLARLQHSHIVPLYSVEDDPARGLRALCMPYFGGTTLARLLEALGGLPPGRRAGADVRAALARMADAAPARRGHFLADLSYTATVCRIGFCLADALHYAHERGLVHFDVKPSNVLVAADGTPMLLDFHLARGPIGEGGPAPDQTGGTPGYMAPEQWLAFDAVRAGRDVEAAVDGRADLYALGVVLYEALAGALPSGPAAPARALRRANPEVSPGLAAVVARCLAARPERRYPDGAALADDLRRHLAHLPLRGVPNRADELLRKWRRRRPFAAPVLALLVLLACTVGAGYTYIRHKAREALDGGGEAAARKQYDVAIADLKGGLSLAEGVPFLDDLRREMSVLLRRAELARTAAELHACAEQIRALEGGEPPPARQARFVERRCRAFWEKRAVIAENLGADPQARADMLDLAIIWADLRVRLAEPEGKATAREAALATLGQAEALFGSSRALGREYQVHALALGNPDKALMAERRGAAREPNSAWEHQALGRALLRAGDWDRAEAEFDRALALRPQDLWPHFYKGRCALRAGRLDEALAAFTACAALAPESAWCFHNRALTHAALGRPDRALADYDRALQLNPALADAALNRGMLHYGERRYHEALADLDRARVNGAAPAAVAYDLALVHQALGDRDAARAELRQALGHDPDHREARTLLERLDEKR